MKKPIPLPTGFNSWLDYAIATMDARGTFLDRLFTHDDVPGQEDIRAAAKAELDALRANAASWVQDQTNGGSRISYRRLHSAFVSRSAEDFGWLNETPVGREFGSPDYEKLMEQDMREFRSNLSSLIKECSDLADAKTGDVDAEERQAALNVQIALQELGQPVSLEVAAEVWRHHSNSLMAGWLDAWCGDDQIGQEDPVFLLHKRQMGRLAYRWPDVIVFLDFDGVMHPFNQTDLFCREEPLARVLRDFPEVEVVISSSWRQTHTLKNMLTFFLTDLRSRVVGVTPVIEIRDAVDVPGVRLREINKYLVDTGNQHRRWVALDDAPELFPPRCAELVLCDGTHGFGEAEAQTLRARLQHKPEHPPSSQLAPRIR